MSKPFRRSVGSYKGSYKGAKGLRAAAEAMTQPEKANNDGKYVIHFEDRLFVAIEGDKICWVQGNRNDGTGFKTKAEAVEAAKRHGLSNDRGDKIAGPIKKSETKTKREE